MADLPEAPPRLSPRLGWCLALYPRLSRPARRRLAAMLVAATLVAQPLVGFARPEREVGASGGNFRAPIIQRAPASSSGGLLAANPSANPAVERALGGLGLEVPAAPSALDNTPAGSEFQVNSFTTSFQVLPAVAMDADGDFVVVWASLGSSGTDTSGSSIQAQRYDAAGNPQGSQFQVNAYTTGDLRLPAVAMDADGDFVVVWESDGSGGTDTSGFSIQAQRYDASGTPQGGQFQVNTFTTGNQRYPAVAMDADGDFVVVLHSYGSGGSDTSLDSIQGQRYDAAGGAVGSEFQVNTYTTNNQRYPAVAMDADGDFVAVWQSAGSGGSDTNNYSIQGQRYTAAGGALGSEFQVNTYTTGNQRFASVAMDADGNFVVVWESSGSGGTDTSSISIQGQRYDASGTPQGGEFQVNTYTTGNQRFASVAVDADGDFVVVWESYGSGGTDTSDSSIQAQRYLSANPATPTPPPPTAVDLRSFRAIGLAERAILVWETASEADTLGFDVLRAASAEGPWTPVNAALIPATGSAAAGQTYVLRDAPGPGAWYYRLEELGAGGKRTMRAAAEVRVGSDASGTTLFLPNMLREPR